MIFILVGFWEHNPSLFGVCHHHGPNKTECEGIQPLLFFDCAWDANDVAPTRSLWGGFCCQKAFRLGWEGTLQSCRFVQQRSGLLSGLHPLRVSVLCLVWTSVVEIVDNLGKASIDIDNYVAPPLLSTDSTISSLTISFAGDSNLPSDGYITQAF